MRLEVKESQRQIYWPLSTYCIVDRQILDAASIANECIDSCIKSNLPGGICMLDTKKAYDHVSWDFLMATQGKLAFLSSGDAGWGVSVLLASQFWPKANPWVSSLV